MDFTPNIVEIWTLYGIGTCMVFVRAFCRTRLVGLRGYCADDYLIWFAWAVYSEVTVIAHVFILKAQGRHTSLLTPAQRENLPLSDYQAWEYGTQVFIVGLTSYAVIVWTLKFNMLFFYRRVVKGLWVEQFILPAMCFVGAAAIAIILVLTCICVPFKKMWQIRPDPGHNCVPQNGVIFYTILSLNLVTDLCIMLIPLPILKSVNAGPMRRLGLFFLFSLGIFCMVAAILRVVLVFKLNQSGISAMWSIREDFVAVFVGQAPMVYPIFKRRFWANTLSSSGPAKSDEASYEMGKLSTSKVSKTSKKSKSKDPYSISRIVGGTTVGGTQMDITRSESQEKIIEEDAAALMAGNGNERDKNKHFIQVEQTFDVDSQQGKFRPQMPWETAPSRR
ncbi:hypothetical protein K458DRAFT_427868 [Lentithecium fluviatile CBS 122367]|uniref:Rhodopsin domain-containing protein n=1 Tax=Lentithecium fluviatile CBS 122367 TaxID=1168545 RepID=A0A6G1JGT1_9PLEO|nr:hypothetical protein K458DRAFT_427868 [Lentithecium fluviatile CBS 122367]